MPRRATRESDLDSLKQLRFHVKHSVDDGALEPHMLYALDRAIDVATANTFTQGALGRVTEGVLNVNRVRLRRRRRDRDVGVELIEDEESPEESEDGETVP